MRNGPLDGLLVIDLTRFVSGPYCSMLMADAGATVVKVEKPGGDPARENEPAVPLGIHKVNATFLRMNRNKQSIELDLKSKAGREALELLIERADVRGAMVSDAYLAALAIEHGCELVTTDSDFARFHTLRWSHPLARS